MAGETENLIFLLTYRYNVLFGQVRKKFVSTLTLELGGI